MAIVKAWARCRLCGKSEYGPVDTRTPKAADGETYLNICNGCKGRDKSKKKKRNQPKQLF